jgi:hypothetical protein
MTINIYSVCVKTCPARKDAEAKCTTKTLLSASNIDFIDYTILQCLISYLEEKNSSYIVRDAESNELNFRSFIILEFHFL